MSDETRARGDLLGVACGAILVPSGSGVDQAGSVRTGHVTSAWVGELGSAVQDGFLDDAPDASRPVVRVIDRDGIRRPAVWAGFSGDQGDEPLAFYTCTTKRWPLITLILPGGGNPPTSRRPCAGLRQA